MNKFNPPTTLGVFKPVGHTVMAFQTEAALEATVAKLAGIGFLPSSLVQYSDAEMSAQVEAELSSVGVTASFGYELDLRRMHGDLAEQGFSFLVVEAPSDASASLVADVVRVVKPAMAQHYGRFIIQDLTEHPPAAMGWNEQ